LFRIYLQPIPGGTWVGVKRDGKLWALNLIPTEEKLGLNQVFAARVEKVLPGIEGAFLELGKGEKGFCNVAQADWKEGQTHLVQIKRLAEGNKEHLVTLDIKLTGFLVIYLPKGRGLRFSKRFRGDRKALQDAFEQAGLNEEGGWIVRSGHRESTPDAVVSEAQSMAATWCEAEQQLEKSSKARRLLAEHPVLEMIKGYVSDGIEGIQVESGACYELMQQLLGDNPSLMRTLAVAKPDQPLFDVYDIQNEIERLLQPRVWLKSGGYLDFYQTPAMTTIDINTGKNTKAKAVMKANREACFTIADQLRLRKWGGLVAIDFANTPHKSDRVELDKLLRKAFEDDPEPLQFQPTNSFFVAMISRRNSGTSWRDFFLRPCPHCRQTQRFGFNWVLYQIYRGLYSYRDQDGAIHLHVSPQLWQHLQEHQSDWLAQVEQMHQLRIECQKDPALRRIEDYELFPAD
jgi:ribonuclease G